jgi:hypothetical protein
MTKLSNESLKLLREKLITELANQKMSGTDTTKVEAEIRLIDAQLGLDESSRISERKVLCD